MEKTEKKEKLYCSIKEVAQMFGLKESTLRFWEKEFEEIAPRKTGRGTRSYLEEDIEQVRLVYHLVKVRKMTLAGARLKLKNNKDTIVNEVEIVNHLNAVRSELISMADALKEYENGRGE